jgi:hypothetical protein
LPISSAEAGTRTDGNEAQLHNARLPIVFNRDQGMKVNDESRNTNWLLQRQSADPPIRINIDPDSKGIVKARPTSEVESDCPDDHWNLQTVYKIRAAPLLLTC